MKHVHDRGGVAEIGVGGVEILLVQVPRVSIESVIGKKGEKVGEEHDDLTIVARRHGWVGGGATRGRGWGATSKESVRGHGEIDVLGVALADV